MDIPKRGIAMYEAPEVKGVYSEGGKGRKQCSCGAFVHVRSQVCPKCNKAFVKKEVVVVSKKEEVVEQNIVKKEVDKYDAVSQASEFRAKQEVSQFYSGRGGLMIHAPAGDCPVKLKGTSQEEVWDWIEKVLNAGKNAGVNYSLEAVRYFVRKFYDLFSVEWKIVVGHILDWKEGVCGVSPKDQV